MDRYFLAKKVKGAVVPEIPTNEEVEKYSEQDDDPSSFLKLSLLERAEKCAQIIKKQYPHYKEKDVVKAAAKLMFSPPFFQDLF